MTALFLGWFFLALGIVTLLLAQIYSETFSREGTKAAKAGHRPLRPFVGQLATLNPRLLS